ncbi:MAG: FG-GAP repeat protein [Alphaproteobacteria bacterium]|nr:FG-GAP repeat protein [Alphaproteobacteria bacterium]MCB9699727.1 FG-GAP repeat protein [Alphaproteobacteria bacterium]
MRSWSFWVGVVATGLAGSPALAAPRGADWSAQSDEFFRFLGLSVASAGDLNGDGYDDLVVGAPGSVAPNTLGLVQVYFGSAVGPSATPSWTGVASQVGDDYGAAVASAGDVNGDGYDDLIVGAFGHQHGQVGEGAAYVYLGSPTGPGNVPDWTGEPNVVDATYGVSVASAGDVNGDGYDDVVIGAANVNQRGVAYVYLGSASGLRATHDVRLRGDQAGAYFGGSVAGAGDVNGDGYDDVVVGARFFTNDGGSHTQQDEGAIFLFLGSPTGLRATADWIGEGEAYNANLGVSVAGAGDVNGDGYDDLIAGSSMLSDGLTEQGGARIWLGSPTGPGLLPSWAVVGDQRGGHAGYAVAGVGDVDGDGFDDVVVGAPDHDGLTPYEGAAALFLGSPTGPSTTAALSVQSNNEQAYLGFSLAGAGDVNGDGLSDVVLGAPGYHDRRLDEGAAFVYLGR